MCKGEASPNCLGMAAFDEGGELKPWNFNRREGTSHACIERIWIDQMPYDRSCALLV
jgi:hypothetical protein